MCRLKKNRLFMTVLVLLISIFLSGCFGGTKTPVFYTFTGTVVEEGTENPLMGAEISLGSKSVETGQDGSFQFSGLLSGKHTIKVTLDGYNPEQKEITLNANSTMKVELTTDGPLLTLDALTIPDLSEDGAVDTTSITLSGNVHDLLATRGVRPLTTAITISQLQALVNGQIYNIEVEEDGFFNQDVPLDPGENTIQLRVFDDQGHAGTSEILRVTLTLPRIDLRVILSWDSDDNDVDLHLFKRDVDQPNLIADFDKWGSEPQHVWWSNKTPDDFGPDEKNNPVLDIDDTHGFGPETILLEEAGDGNYHIWVHYYNDRYVEDPFVATVRIILHAGTDDATTYTRSKELSEEWEVWYVGTISMPSGNLIEVEPQEPTGPAALSNTTFTK